MSDTGRTTITDARTSRYGTTVYEVNHGLWYVIYSRNDAMTCLDLDGAPVVSSELRQELEALIRRVRARGGPVSQSA